MESQRMAPKKPKSVPAGLPKSYVQKTGEGGAGYASHPFGGDVSHGLPSYSYEQEESRCPQMRASYESEFSRRESYPKTSFQLAHSDSDDGGNDEPLDLQIRKEPATFQTFPQEASTSLENPFPKKKKVPECRFCANHGKKQILKGHKNYCDYAECDCTSCEETRKCQYFAKKEQQKNRLLQRKIAQRGTDDQAHPSQTAPDAREPSQMQRELFFPDSRLSEISSFLEECKRNPPPFDELKEKIQLHKKKKK